MEKRPVFEQIGPIWWHHHGTKMKLVNFNKDTGHIRIEGSAAKLSIDRATVADRWVVEWEVIHIVDEQQVQGWVHMNNLDLAAAFGLRDYVDELSKWLIDRFGGSAANQGKFIRYRDYLNIPCPGTGHDGDPNISIEIDEEIKDAVKAILTSTKAQV